MRLRKPAPPDPLVRTVLEAIDDTLAGEAVDPRHAELAELALLLRDERPDPRPGWAAELDERLEKGFVSVQKPVARRWWRLAPAAGAVASLLIAVLIVASGSHPAVRAGNSKLPFRTDLQAATSTAARSNAAALTPNVLQAPATGRKTIQGAQLSLSTAPSRVDTVAQELFDVAARFGAIVQSSAVSTTTGPGSYGQFQLSIPSGSLSQAMAALSTLQYARVSSRTDTTEDVNDQYEADVSALADARALRTSLLRQLANATTQAQIASLTTQIHDAEASISSDEATLRGLTRQINFSQVTVTINAAAITPVAGPSSFTIGKAAHDAGRVLTVAAGVALIGLAALTPVALLVALGWWIRVAWRRRRREQALDLA